MRSGKQSFEPVNVDNRNFVHKISKVGVFPFSWLEQCGINNDLKRFCFQRCQTRRVTIGKEVQNQRNSNVRHSEELNEFFRVRRCQDSKIREFLVVKVQNIVFRHDRYRFCPLVLELFTAEVDHGRWISSRKTRPLNLCLATKQGEESSKSRLFLLGLFHQGHSFNKFLRMILECNHLVVILGVVLVLADD